MADETTGAVEAPEAGAEAPATESQQTETTEPTPVQEAMGPVETREAAFEEAMSSIREQATEGGEEPPEEPTPEETPEETPEPVSEGEEAVETEEVPEVTAEEAVQAEEGPAPEELPEGYAYDEQGALHGPDGRYASPAELEAVESGEGPPEALEPADDIPEAPEGFEMIELPPDHPLRDRGETHMPIPSAEEVGEQTHQYYRSLINAGVRQRQMAEELDRTRQHLAYLTAEKQVAESDEGKEWDPENNPELREQIEDHRRAYGDESADRLIEALKEKRQRIIEERAQETLSETRDAHVARQFTAAVVGRANDDYAAWPGWVAMHNGQLVGEGERYEQVSYALMNYAQLVENTGMEPDPGRFFRHLDAVYIQDPRVQRQIEQHRKRQPQERQKTEDEIRAEREQEERERMKDAARRRKKNPHAELGGGQKTDRTTPRPETEELDTTGMSADRARDAVMEKLGIVPGG